METVFLVVRTIAAIVAMVVLIIWLVIEHRRKHPKSCDSCAHLEMAKKSSSSGRTGYRCDLYGYFVRKNAPTYCSSHRPREEEKK